MASARQILRMSSRLPFLYRIYASETAPAKHGRFIDVNGIRMHYLEFGKEGDTPFIYAPGSTGTAYSLINVAEGLVDAARTQDKPVAGYGVSVGTTTLLPQFGLTDKIDFLVDDDPNKDDALTGPGYRIPVLPAEAIYQRNPGAIIVFAWRYAYRRDQRRNPALGAPARPLDTLQRHRGRINPGL